MPKVKDSPPRRPMAEIELLPDAWERFEKAVAAAAKHGPMHRITKPKPSRDSRLKKGRKSDGEPNAK